MDISFIKSDFSKKEFILNSCMVSPFKAINSSVSTSLEALHNAPPVPKGVLSFATLIL